MKRSLAGLLVMITLAVCVPAQERKPFWKQRKFWIGIGITAVGVGLDHYSTGRVEELGYRERTPFLRRSNGELNAGRLWALWGATNAALVLLEIPRSDEYSWAAFGVRALVGINAGRVGIRNLNLPPLPDRPK